MTKYILNIAEYTIIGPRSMNFNISDLNKPVSSNFAVCHNLICVPFQFCDLPRLGNRADFSATSITCNYNVCGL